MNVDEKAKEIIITLKPEMLEVVKQALADYAGDKNSKEYLEVIDLVQQEKEEK